MTLIGAAGLDLAAVPIGDNYTMGPDDALEAVRLLKPRRVVPIHNGTWPIIAQDAHAWARRVRPETGSRGRRAATGREDRSLNFDSFSLFNRENSPVARYRLPSPE